MTHSLSPKVVNLLSILKHNSRLQTPAYSEVLWDKETQEFFVNKT